LSFHFRGPIHLKQFAVYSPSATSKFKREITPATTRRTAHIHSLHKAEIHKHKRKIISATIDGQVASWKNNYFGPSANAAPADPKKADMVTATIDGQVVSWVNNWFGPAPTTAPHIAEASGQDMVTATIDGQVVSWVNNWHGPFATQGPAAVAGGSPNIGNIGS
jgi:hypothetical protein